MLSRFSSSAFGFCFAILLGFCVLLCVWVLAPHGLCKFICSLAIPCVHAIARYKAKESIDDVLLIAQRRTNTLRRKRTHLYRYMDYIALLNHFKGDVIKRDSHIMWCQAAGVRR